MPRRSNTHTPILTWSADTELVSLTLTLQPQADFQAPTHYATQLHSWFLNQIRRIDPTLSAYLHDGQSEKAFSLSSLSGDIQSEGRTLHFRHDRTYHWSIAALSPSVCQGLQHWLTHPPELMQLRSGGLTIQQWNIGLPATTYETIWRTAIDNPELEPGCLTFTTPTSFRKRSNHLPLPMPENVFHSYLRRWNNFASVAVDQAEFLNWINECVVILRHEIRSQKTQAGKQGSVTGFIGSVQFGLTPKAQSNSQYVQLFYALLACAPYFGTGHKVTFGLGETRSGWSDQEKRDHPTEARSTSVEKRESVAEPRSTSAAKIAPDTPTNEEIRTQRQAELKALFLSRKKRQGGERAEKAAALWATILVGQEFGETLREIAVSLDLPYETVKRYAGRAHQELDKSKQADLT